MTSVFVVSALRNISFGFIVAGTLFAINSFSYLTGIVLIDAMSALNSFVWGSACILAGVLLSIMGRPGNLTLNKKRR